jgi:NADH:ubiquinone oxidoreductase subunit 4 (subunit M)
VLQKVFQGSYDSEQNDEAALVDLSRHEMIFYLAMMAGLVWMGMYPKTFLDLSAMTLGSLF